MMVANSWAAYMIGPIGIDKETGQFIGTAWQAVNNPLWHPLNIHRFLGNVAFGGLICGGYAAIKYLGAQTPEERARYDWRRYVGNFCAVCHGSDGKPKLKEARDFRDARKMNKFTDSYWFWRISEGAPGTKMPPWKGAFTEKQRWQGMAYEHQFSHDGKAEEHAHPEMNSADKKAE